MKSYTDLEQSKKLAEILPLESADMHYYKNLFGDYIEGLYNSNDLKEGCELKGIEYIPCWSLAALLNILPSSTLDSSNDHHYRLHCMERFTEWYGNPIDACYEMINKLHEQKLL